MPSNYLSALSLQNYVFHCSHIAVHYIVIYDDIFTGFNFCILNESSPNRFLRDNFTFVVSHDTLSDDDVTVRLKFAFTNRTVYFNIAAGLDIESIFNITTANNSSKEIDVACLVINTFDFKDRFNRNLVSHKKHLSIDCSNDSPSIGINFDVLTKRHIDVFAVF